MILREHDVVVKPFTQKALDCLPSDDWYITEEEI